MKFSPHWTIFMVRKNTFSNKMVLQVTEQKKTVNWITSQNVQIIEDWPAEVRKQTF